MISSGIRNNKKNRDSFLKAAIEKIKADTEKYFKSLFKCKSGDGGFHYLTDSEGNIYNEIKNYINEVAEVLGVHNIEIPDHYIIHKGVYHRSSWLPYYEKDIVNNYTFCGHNVFSYAFIYSPSDIGEINFSFTLDMN